MGGQKEKSFCKGLKTKSTNLLAIKEKKQCVSPT